MGHSRGIKLKILNHWVLSVQVKVEEGYYRLSESKEEEEQDPFKKPHLIRPGQSLLPWPLPNPIPGWM